MSRLYNRPLTIQRAYIREITNSSITINWEDDNYNKNANITAYEIVLQQNNTIYYRVLVNSSSTSYIFPSLRSNTLYTITIYAIDTWNRYSGPYTLNGTTLLLTYSQTSTFLPSTIKLRSSPYPHTHHRPYNHLVTDYVLCFHSDNSLLFIFNRTTKSSSLVNTSTVTHDRNDEKILYNITVYDSAGHLLLNELKKWNGKPELIIYHTKRKVTKNGSYSVQLLALNEFNNHGPLLIGAVTKLCEDIRTSKTLYSPLLCTINEKNHLYIQLIDNPENSIHLKPVIIYYRLSQTNFMRTNISDIDNYISRNVADIGYNYSVIIENILIGSNEKLNTTVPCAITRIALIGKVTIKRDNRVLGGIIAGLILSIICLTILSFFIAYKKGKTPDCRHILLRYEYVLRKKLHPRTNLISTNSEGNYFDINHKETDLTAIPIAQFESYVESMHKDADFGFIRLFEDICEISKSYTFTANVSQLDYNKIKNRYTNILTYDHSRVKLSSDDKDERNSYINANYVDGHHRTNTYIATQGPTSHTINDFWRMIFEKDVSVIVMITNIKERGRVKCDTYWPVEGTETYGTIQVTLLTTITLAYYVKRIFAIRCKINRKRVTYERLVYQFHYTDWPDHGVPVFVLPALSFIRKSSQANPEGAPIVVHCSAGVGRTGTYIVIDTMLKTLKEQRSINIPSFLKQIRQQRNFLVQTEEQFIFIYDVLVEAINEYNFSSNGLNDIELNEYNFDYSIQMLDYFDNDSNLTRLDKQFNCIVNSKIKDYDLLAGRAEINLLKNRTQAILPVNPTRVILTKKTNMSNGDEYINATFLNGCYRPDEYIITQHPLVNTIMDFWQMIWDTNSSLIVSLYGDEKTQPDVMSYWPILNQIMDCGNFSVCLVDETFECDYVYRDFVLQSTEEDYELRVKQVVSSYWPDACSPIMASFTLIHNIRKLRMLNTNGPIVVHDLFGGHRAATFCALYTMNDQIEIDGSLNVYELAKLYHMKRPSIWRHSGDLFYLYRCAEILLKDYKISVNPSGSQTMTSNYHPNSYHGNSLYSNQNQNNNNHRHQRYQYSNYNHFPTTQSYIHVVDSSIQPSTSQSQQTPSTIISAQLKITNVAQNVMDSFSKRRQKSRSYRPQTLKRIFFLNNESPL
ncbi:unnamed protein product [Didymodactylos carnosus]|uniref:protein-tyrosine-phosphatase n=1 Tax=Didymodactylos carnosus TaxID=1234261 RepID=A0A813X694_9BILA|nr:unnamed protein product [Didymodactylos carnosus]CAF0865237.1 unnamed protein product [Didymodactylos carnosus]CAF3512888.1 unnamed protein product [Didymodactylos carnosus]CAF3652770.1 unnamed protein product [Didymodactylos carnosus]